LGELQKLTFNTDFCQCGPVDTCPHGVCPRCAERAYFTKEFWTRKVEQLDDVSGVEIKIGKVEVKQRKGFDREAMDAHVEVIAEWEVKRTPPKGRKFDNHVVVPLNKRMGRDAIIDKVLARTYKAIYQLSGGVYILSGGVYIDRGELS
jgi:hypothetical protein